MSAFTSPAGNLKQRYRFMRATSIGYLAFQGKCLILLSLCRHSLPAGALSIHSVPFRACKVRSHGTLFSGNCAVAWSYCYFGNCDAGKNLKNSISWAMTITGIRLCCFAGVDTEARCSDAQALASLCSSSGNCDGIFPWLDFCISLHVK